MPHNFDLSAYITKSLDNENKLVIQLKMAYNWGNYSNQKPQPSELTWEEQNFMQEEEEKNDNSKTQSKPDFSEYEWMVNSEEFDSQAMKKIEQDDDIDDMFYWDPSKGCVEGKSATKRTQDQSPIDQNDFVQKNFNNNIGSTNPFSSNFQNSATQHRANPSLQSSGSIFQNFDQDCSNKNQIKQVGLQNSFQDRDDRDCPLSHAMNGVNLNKFHLNPEATTFVPSWLKK